MDWLIDLPTSWLIDWCIFKDVERELEEEYEEEEEDDGERVFVEDFEVKTTYTLLQNGQFLGRITQK